MSTDKKFCFYSFNSNNTITRLFKYINMPKDKFNLSANLINPKYGFGDFTYLLQQINYGLNNFSVNASSPENAKQIKNLIDIYTKEFASFLSYLFVTHGEDFGKQIEDFCKCMFSKNIENCRLIYDILASKSLEEADVLLPRWIVVDDDKILERFCKLSDRNITHSLVPNKVP